MLIDINAHLGPYAFRQIRHHTSERLLGLMDRNRIDAAVVSSNTSLTYRDAHRGNEELHQAVQAGGGRLVPIATVNPTYAGWQADMEQALDEWGMKAVRLAPHYHGYCLNDRNGQAVLSVAAKRGVPVVLHQRIEDRRQQHAWDRAEDLRFAGVAEAARRNPDLRFILLNWLGISGQAVIDAGLKDRVLIDLTRFAVVVYYQLPRLIDAIGTQAVAFGTHAPFNYVGPALVRLEALKLSGDDAERVAWRNAAQFLQIDVPGAVLAR